jgi:hypothetical protein
VDINDINLYETVAVECNASDNGGYMMGVMARLDHVRLEVIKFGENCGGRKENRRARGARSGWVDKRCIRYWWRGESDIDDHVHHVYEYWAMDMVGFGSRESLSVELHSN